jgi:hypothetical protein
VFERRLWECGEGGWGVVGCYTGRTRSYAATEPGQVWTQPE